MTPNATSPPASAPNVVPLAGTARDAARGATPVTVLLAHGQRLARAGLRLLIDGDDGLAVAGEAGTGEHAVALARRRLPDIVVIDLELPGLDALEAMRRISADPALAAVRLLALTPGDSHASVVAPLRAGAAGLVLADSEPDDLLAAIRGLAGGETPLSPGLLGALIADVRSRPEPPRSDAAALAELTEREREIVALVALGLDNREIARHLVISPATSRTHVSRAMRKVDARDRAQLVAFAYQTGLAAPGASEPPAGIRRLAPGSAAPRTLGADRRRELLGLGA